MDDLDEYEEKKKQTTSLSAPNYITLVDSTTQKSIDFKTMASMLLGITYEELYKCIKFTVSPESNEVVYWDCVFSHEVLGIKVSLSDIDFCFDTTHHHGEDPSKPPLFQTQNAALRHILLKIIMIVKPNIVNEWMKKGGYRPIVVHENCHGKLTDKVEYIDGKRGLQRFGLHGWFVIFVSRFKIYGCDISLLQFDGKVRCLIDDKGKEQVYCFGK